MVTDYLARRFDFVNDPDLAQVFDEGPFWSSRFGSLLLDEVPLAPGQTILDVGCATGFPLFELAFRCGRSCRVVGVDSWPAAVARAGYKTRVYGLDHVHVVLGDAAHLPLSDASVDLITSNLAVNNFADAPAAFAECARVAKSGARLALATNPSGTLRELYVAYRETLVALGLEARLDRLAADEARRGTRESVSALVEAAGFRVARAVEREVAIRYVDGAALMRHWLTMVGFLGGWRSAVEPDEEETVFAALEARLDRMAREHGGLRMTVPLLYLEAVRDGNAGTA